MDNETRVALDAIRKDLQELTRQQIVINRDVKELKAGQQEIVRAIAGEDPMDPNAEPGIARMVERHEVALEGSERPRRIGLMENVESLMQLKKGMMFSAGVLGAIFGLCSWGVPILLKMMGLLT